MKFNGRRDLAPRLGELLAAHSGRYLGRIDSVVPIPLHEARLHKRGFNQSALIAREVASFLHVNLDTHTLKRTRYALPQVRQRASERAQSIQDAFAAAPLANTVRAVLLIDDVTTTGATLRAAHQALLDAGATTVYTLALAQTAAPNGNFTTQSN